MSSERQIHGPNQGSSASRPELRVMFLEVHHSTPSNLAVSNVLSGPELRFIGSPQLRVSRGEDRELDSLLYLSSATSDPASIARMATRLPSQQVKT